MSKNLNDIVEGLKTQGLPVAHRQREVGHVPDLPYVIYYETGKEPFYADNQTYYLNKAVTVELCSDYKDEELETRLESFFYAQDIPLSYVEENNYTEEHLYVVSYEFEL